MTTPPLPLPDIGYELADTRDRVTLSIGAERLVLGAAEVENLIKFLGMMRAAMTPAVPPEPPDGFLVADVPRVVVLPSHESTRATFIARTAQFGWIALQLDREQAAGIGARLADLATRMQDTH